MIATSSSMFLTRVILTRKVCFLNTRRYEGRVEVAVFLRSNIEISLRSDINQADGKLKHQKNLLFNLRMSDEEYKLHRQEIIEACNGIAQALLPYRRERCLHSPAPYWEIVTRKGYR